MSQVGLQPMATVLTAGGSRCLDHVHCTNRFVATVIGGLDYINSTIKVLDPVLCPFPVRTAKKHRAPSTITLLLSWSSIDCLISNTSSPVLKTTLNANHLKFISS